MLHVRQVDGVTAAAAGNLAAALARKLAPLAIVVGGIVQGGIGGLNDLGLGSRIHPGKVEEHHSLHIDGMSCARQWSR